MADSVTDVEKMHENLKAKCLDLAKKEISDISNYAAKNGQFEPLAAWDVSYWYIYIYS
jgi:oligopeptidase A